MALAAFGRPGTAATGIAIAAAFALIAQSGALSAGLVWDDVELVARDERIRDLGYVLGAFGDSFFGDFRPNEMYRPVVNASFALDWFLSRSTPGDVSVGWFHLVNVVLHAVNAGLAYVFLAALTGRRLGAPLLAAVLFAVHPLAVEPVAWLAGRCDLLAMTFGLASGWMFLMTPQRPRMLVPAVLLYGLSLFAKASLATLPLLLALSVVAYRSVPPAKLFGRRLLPRFAAFALPAAVWIAARIAVLGSPFPTAGGRRWQHVGLLEGALGVGRAFALSVGNLVLPARLCGDYAADPLTTPSTLDAAGTAPVAYVGLAALLVAAVAGAVRLRRTSWGFPVLAFVISLLPVLQVVPIGCITADRFLYFPMLFAFLLVGEGLERLYVRALSRSALPVTFTVIAALIVLSHARAPVFAGDVSFNRDVLVSYPGARFARQRLAVALSETGREEDREEARALLRDALVPGVLQRPNEELRILGALELEAGNLDAAEPLLLRALEMAADPLARAQNLYNLAVLARAHGDDVTAAARARQSLEAMPGYPPARAILERLE